MGMFDIIRDAKAFSIAGIGEGAKYTGMAIGFTGHNTADGIRKVADGIDWATDKAVVGCDNVHGWAQGKIVAMAQEIMEAKVSENASVGQATVENLQKATENFVAESKKVQGAIIDAAKKAKNNVVARKAKATEAEVAICIEDEEAIA